jgi:hypothetical protein
MPESPVWGTSIPTPQHLYTKEFPVAMVCDEHDLDHDKEDRFVKELTPI